MERRQFLRVCTMVAGAAQLGSVGDAWAGAEPRLYGRSKLVDVHGAPIRLGDLALKTNYVFNYPYAGTPCFLLDYDGATDGVAALGTVGAEQFDAFFRKYDFKLTMEYGQGKARMPVGATTVVRELTAYCRNTVSC